MKKLFAFLMSLSLVFAMTVTSFAETVNINGDLSDHTFEFYQILSGDQTATDSSTLANIQWGSGIDSTAFVADLVNYETGDPATKIFASVDSAEKFAEILANYQDYSDVANAIAEMAFAHLGTKTEVTITDGSVDLDPGYYLIVDTTNVNGSADAKNKALLQVTKNEDIEISLKTMKPTFNKKVQDNEGTPTWGDYADYNIGDEVPFKLTATFPTTGMDYYDAYAIKMTDTYDTTLFEYVADSAEVYVSGTKDDALTANVNTTTAGSIVFEDTDIKHYTAKDNEITVEVYFKLKLKTTANVTATTFVSNPNSATLEFSNDPNSTGKGLIRDQVDVYTYQVELNKTNTKGEKLAGVGFQLTNAAGEYLTADGTWTTTETEILTNADGKITFKGLDEGTYTLIESKPLGGYNSIPNKTVVITSDADDTATEAPDTLTITVDNTEVTSIDVVNKQGSVLPETGGMGTTLFYVLGGALVVVAGVILVSRKRMEK